MIEYTKSEKIIKAKMCKGLSTARTKTLDSALVPDDCETVFDVIERVKDLIYDFNQSPDGECAICLLPFDGALYKVEQCFHLFHAECFSVYLFETLSRLKEENSILPDDKKIPEVIKCPICRAVLDISPGDFRKYRPKKNSVVKRTSLPTDEFAKMAISRQRQFQQAFNRQAENDGHFSETVNCLYIRPDEPAQPQQADHENEVQNDKENENKEKENKEI